MKIKSLLPGAFILFISFSLQAQTEKGSVYLGGSINFSSVAEDPLPNSFPQYTQVQFTVSPSVAWAYKTNRFFGFSLSWSGNKSTDTLNNFSTNSFEGSVFLRQYKPLGKGFYLFAQESLGAGFTNGNVYSYNLNSFQSSVAISPGLAYNVSKHLQLELNMNDIIGADYNYSKYSGDASVAGRNSNNFSFSSSLQGSYFNSMTFGVRYFL